MKKLAYKVVVSGEDFEAKVSEMLNQGWKPLGGIAFNHSFPHQAMAKVVDTADETPPSNKQAPIDQIPTALTANEAMKMVS